MSDLVAVALDFETADWGADSACALGMARVRLASGPFADPGAPDCAPTPAGEVEDTFYSLIRPPRRRVHFTEIHGLTWAMVKDSPSFAELWPRCSAFLEGADYLVAHNAAFDRRVLYGCCETAGLTPPAAPFLCTVKGSRKGLGLPHNRLSDVCAHLGIALQHHHAASDALASARIFLHLQSIGLGLEAMRLK